MVNNIIDGDTINSIKYRKEGIQAQQYQKRREQQELERINSRSEVVPVLSQKIGVIDKLRGKKDIYNHRVRGIGMSGADPVGQFVVETIALAPVGKLLKPAVFKKKPKFKITTGIDGKPYNVDSKVSQSALHQYQVDSMIYPPETRVVPDAYLLDQNVLRELSWAPESVQKPLTEMVLTGKTSSPTALLKLPYKQKISAIKTYGRALKGQNSVKKPIVRTYSNMQAMPKAEMKKLKYKPIAENVQGVHTESGNYLNDIYAENASSTAYHEATHGYQKLNSYSKPQKQLLKDTYLLPNNIRYVDSDSVWEMGATNAEIRKYLADQLGHKPTYNELNAYIKSLTDNQAVNLFNTFKPNGYMEDYAAGLAQLPKNQIPQWVQNFKLSQIKVPVLTEITIGLNKNRRND